MPKVTTKFTFTLKNLDSKEETVDALNAFVAFVEKTYARKEVSVPLNEIEISGDTSINLNPNSMSLRVVVTTTAPLTLTLIDNKDNLCSVGTLVELKIKNVGAVAINIDIPPATAFTETHASSSYRSRYYFKSTAGWIALN